MLHILTGFLGSGKTTFLRQWLDFLHGRERYTGVIQNEFGEIGLDAALLRGETQVEALDEGCVCCSLADSLRPGLLRLIGDMPAEQFILETTGLANPANVMEALSELRDIVQPGLGDHGGRTPLICAVRKGTLRASAGRRRHGRT